MVCVYYQLAKVQIIVVNACKNSRYDTADKDMHIVMASHGAIAEISSSQETWTVYEFLQWPQHK